VSRRDNSGYRVVGSANWSSRAKPSPSTINRYSCTGLRIGRFLKGDTDRVIRLKQRLWEQNGIPKFTIIPPVWNKDAVNQSVFQTIWRRAARDTTSGSRGTDRLFLHTHGSLRAVALPSWSSEDAASAAGHRESDSATRQRIRRIFDVPLLRENVIVRQYDEFSELEGELPNCLD